MVVLQPPLVAAHPHLDLVQRRVEGGVGVRALTGRVQLLARSQAHHAVDAVAVPVLGDDDFGVDAASFEIPLDA